MWYNFKNCLEAEHRHILAILLLDIYSTEMHTHVCQTTCTKMFIVAVFVKAKNYQYVSQESNSYIYYMYSQTTEYYTAMHIDEQQLPQTKWLNLTNKILNRVRHKECILYNSVSINITNMQNKYIVLKVRRMLLSCGGRTEEIFGWGRFGLLVVLFSLSMVVATCGYSLCENLPRFLCNFLMYIRIKL